MCGVEGVADVEWGAKEVQMCGDEELQMLSRRTGRLVLGRSIQILLQENSEQLWAGLNWLSTGSSGGFRNGLAKTFCLQQEHTDDRQHQLITELTGRAGPWRTRMKCVDRQLCCVRRDVTARTLHLTGRDSCSCER